jgi:hypothetical protein
MTDVSGRVGIRDFVACRILTRIAPRSDLSCNAGEVKGGYAASANTSRRRGTVFTGIAA